MAATTLLFDTVIEQGKCDREEKERPRVVARSDFQPFQGG